MEYHYAGLRRLVTDETRAGVIEDFPEIQLISDEDLRTKSVEAWSHSLCCSDFHRITDLPPEGNPGSPVLRQGTQADHVRGVVRYAKAIAEEFTSTYPQTTVNWPILMAASVCHDVGKPYEFDAANRARWQSAPADCGEPAFRHSVFGMHVCLLVGLPEEVAHVAVGHSFEGQYMGVSAECMIVRQADHGWWHLAGALGLVVPAPWGGFLRTFEVALEGSNLISVQRSAPKPGSRSTTSWPILACSFSCSPSRTPSLEHRHQAFHGLALPTR